MRKEILILICFYCCGGLCHGQNKKVDSLLLVLKTAKDDTNRVNTLNSLAGELQYTNTDTCIFLSTQALKIAEKLNWQLGIGKSHRNLGCWIRHKGNYALSIEHFSKTLAICDVLEKSGNSSKSQVLSLKSKTLGNIGVVYVKHGDYPKALDYYFKALKIAEELGDNMSQSIHLGNIGLVYMDQSDGAKALEYDLKALKLSQELGDKIGVETNLGNIGLIYSGQDYPKALEYYFKALKMSEELGDKTGISRNLGNIGNIYRHLRDYPKALDYHLKDLKLSREVGDKNSIEIALGNIGIVYDLQGDKPKALDYYLQALKIAEDLGDKNGIARHLGNVGGVYYDQGDYTKALEYHFRALKIYRELGNKSGTSLNLGNIGNVYLKQNNFKKADKFLNDQLKLAEELKNLNQIKDANEDLSELYRKQGDWKKAYELFRQYLTARDSINNEEKARKQTRLEMNFAFEKKETAEKAEQEKKDALSLKELQKQKLLKNFSIGGIGLVLVLFFFIYRTYRARQVLRLYDIRNRIAGDLHDDIGSTLNSISIYSEVAKKKDEHHDEALEMIGEASRKVIDAMSDIVWTINAENDSFAKIIFRMKSLAYNLFRAKNIEFTFHSDEILNEKKLSLEARRNFYLIFKEAVNNLVKYSNAHRVEITLTNENDRINLRILDDGDGFDTSQENAGNGLKSMKRRATEMKAEFVIESAIGRGTTIELILHS